MKEMKDSKQDGVRIIISGSRNQSIHQTDSPSDIKSIALRVTSTLLFTHLRLSFSCICSRCCMNSCCLWGGRLATASMIDCYFYCF